MTSMLRIGISGWRYPPWRKSFYPEGLAQKNELAYAAERFASIELNGSFYSLQRPSSFQKWHDETPDDFMFAVKGNQYVTHMRRLKDVAQPLANFFASGLLNLREKLGPILWQLPPSLKYDEAVMARFLELLPHDTDAAAALAKKRDGSMTGRAALTARGVSQRIRHAIEVRHESFRTPGFIEQLRAHRVAVVFADTAGRWPYFEDLTGDFIYLRLHGDAELYTSGYTEEALQRWARRIALWRQGKEPKDAERIAPKLKKAAQQDVYCYFDNDVKVRSPYDARRLAELLDCASALPPLNDFRSPEGGWAAGLGPRAAARTRMPGAPKQRVR